MPIRQLIKSLIDKNKVFVFSKSYCPYSDRAKNTLSSLNIPFKSLELDTEQNGPEIQETLYQMTNQRTVPNIFINRQHIGGNDSLNDLVLQDKLKNML
ncbi:hypothetical protein BB558_002904 [Smittium angustum]|uniref:Glutaredoxin domain-containing protein n=1 Tax=Smittium angustum TaxID=133377 RepID=A0A2U1J7R4_SMIAN|nr:hypothetical protein BB558_002904 [Smittium angustum]